MAALAEDHLMTKSTGKLAKRRHWSKAELERLRARYPHEPTQQLANALGRPLNTVYAKANQIGLVKTPEYLASPAACRLRRGDEVGKAFRFKPGQTPPNKGLRRPGWAPGRMKETQFKKGQFPANKDPDFYVLGALRINADAHQLRAWCTRLASAAPHLVGGRPRADSEGSRPRIQGSRQAERLS
jgi:hypothetical protein